MVVHSFHLGFIQPLGILGNIIFIIFQKLFLKGQGAAEILITYVSVHHFGHTAQGSIIPEKFKKDIRLNLP